MNCILLAKGEKSLRIGEIKPFIAIHGEPLIEIMLSKTTGIFKKTYIVTTTYKKFRMYENKKTFIIEDKIKCGPIGGIRTGLEHSISCYNFVLSVDLLFVSKELLKYMIEKEKNYDILLIKTGDYFQPLCGIYSKKVLNSMEENIKTGQYSVKSLLQSDKLNIKFIEKKELKKFGDPGILFFNLNTKKDLEFANKYYDTTRKSNIISAE